MIKSKNTTHAAIRSSAGGFTAFSFGGYNIRFRVPYSLERYVDVVRWDGGYLVVMAKYSHNFWSSEHKQSLLLWKDVLPTREVHKHFSENVIQPFKQKSLKIGSLLEKVYKSSLRNAFAHSCYSFETDERKLRIWPKSSGYETYTFDEFQQIFLYSVILMNKMENYQELNHNRAAERNNAITEAVDTPDGVKVQVYGRMVERGDIVTPELRMVKVID